MRSRKPLLACLIGVALAVPALAQTGATVTQYPACPDPPPKLSQAEYDAAHASYKVGVEAYTHSDYQKALDNFKEAFRRDCSKVGLLRDISRAYEGLGNKAEAIHADEVYLQRNPKAEDAEDIQTRIRNLKAQVGTPTTVTATATATEAPTVTATATTTTTAVPTPTATAVPTASGETRSHGLVPWIVVGAGAAAAIGGGVMIGIGQADVSKSRQGCTSNTDGSLACTPPLKTTDGSDRKSLNSTGTTLTNVGLIVGGVGLAAVVGGLVWHFVEPTGPKTTALAPVIAPGYAGLSLAGKF